MSESSVTSWISLLKKGDDRAAKLIWERYFERLCNFARAKLGEVSRRASDEEDLAISAIHALCMGATGERFRQLDNRDDLWQILMMIVARKASNVRRIAGVRRETGECDLGPSGVDPNMLEHLLASEPSSELLDSLDIHCEELLSKLNDKLRQVAILKLSRYTNEEIARLRGRSVSTIERYLQMIRQTWEDAFLPDEE